MRLFLFVILLSVTACSHTQVLDDGTTRVTGFVSLEIAPTENPETFAGQIITVKTIGLAGHSSEQSNGLSVGYTEVKSGFIKNNVLVLGDPKTLN